MPEHMDNTGTPSLRLARLGLGEKAGFAAGDFGFNLFWASIASFLAVFYTDVVGLPAAATGSMLLLTRFFDAMTDPAMGLLADRTRTRWGKYRPWLLFAGLPMAGAAVLTFSIPDTDIEGKLVYAYISFSLMMLCYTMLSIPYSSLFGVMTAHPQERSTLISWRFIAAFAGTSVVNKFTLPLVALLGQGNAERGWQLTMLVYGLAAMLTFILTFCATRERVAPPSLQTGTAWADCRDLLTNRAWLVLVLLAMVSMMTITMRSGSGFYYLKYYVEREDLVSDYLLAQGLALGAGAALTPLFTRIMEKTLLLQVVMALVAVLSAGFYFVPRESIGLIFGMNILISLALGIKSPLTWSMYADCADYNEWRTGRRATALTFAAASFMQKSGGALGSALMLWLLAYVGYVANEAQTGASQTGIVLLQTVIPGVFALLSVVVMVFYPLNNAGLQGIQSDLQQRDAA